MESPMYEQHGKPGYPTASRDGHWQPALRPDTYEASSETTQQNESDSVQTAPVSFHDEVTAHSLRQSTRVPIEPSTYELPSDDDDERLDPAWGIQRMDSAHILDSVHRSPSFPMFSPQDGGFFQSAIPHVPHEPAIHESPPPNPVDERDDKVLQNVDELLGARRESFVEDTAVLSSIKDTGVELSENQNARFQEGMPLIDTQHQPTGSSIMVLQERNANSFLDADDAEDDTSFFSHLGSEKQQLNVPPTLERKSTEDVLDSLHLTANGVPDSPIRSAPKVKPDQSNREVPINDFVPVATVEQYPFPEEIAEDDLIPTTELETDVFSQEQSADALFQTTGFSAEDYTNKGLADDLRLEEELHKDAFAQEPSADELFGTSGFSKQVQPDDADSKWAAVLGDDEFLMEDADDLLPDSEPGSPSSFIASLQDNDGLPDLKMDNTATSQPKRPAQLQQSTSSYTPHQPSTSDMTQLSPRSHTNVGLGRPALAPMGSFQAQLQQPAITPRAESFADQAKGGYKSPYDLPTDLAKPKKRPQTQRLASQSQKGMPPPPPRTSSMSSERQLQPPFTPTTQNFSSTTAPSPFSPPTGGRVVSTPGLPSAGPSNKAASSGFFEELPISSRPRPASGTGRFTPSQSFGASLPQIPSQTPPQGRAPSSQLPPALSKSQEFNSQFQLQPPERLDPYANVPVQSGPMPTTMAPSRYSPAPPGSLGAARPTPSPRYSPAPPSQAPTTANRYASQPINSQTSPSSVVTGNRYASQPISAAPTVSPALPFQPRTSSPLAVQRPPAPTPTSSMMPPPPPPQVDSAAMTATSGPLSPPKQMLPPRGAAPSNLPAYTPYQMHQSTNQFVPSPPKRSQTQSPGQQMGNRPSFPMLSDNTVNRPASAYGHVSPTKANARSETVPVQSHLRPRAMQQELDFIKPTDDTQYDVLERWKGAPIFRFGFGGNIVTSFPTRTPRYSSGLTKPQIKPTSGTVAVQSAMSVFPQTESIVTFPGPLRGKSKKKDVVAWLTASIARLEAESPPLLGLAQSLPDPRRRHEEKVLLWKVVKILVEHDGSLETNTEALKAINTILAPEAHAIDESTASQYGAGTELTGIYRPAGANMRPESNDPLAVETLRKHLLKGKREDAVWSAVDNRMWSHALLIASTLDRSIWKQVVQEFVRQEVKTIGSNAEALAAVYEIFGGNMEESIDQLVPPSARAGLQMVSTVETLGPIKNALDGLDRWKETLTLVLNNRSNDDQRALLTLARLLSSYGRVEAAHICYLFCRGPTLPNLFGGMDDQLSGVVLLGADSRSSDIGLDEDAIILTEIYEFATCTLGGSSVSIPLPHLASYKLQRAKQLADNGMKGEAQAYCEAIAAGIGTKTKVSPYYHPVFLGELDDLSNRLKQVPVQSSSWIAKPTVDKVTGSIFSKFTSFVAGDDSDAASQGSGKDAADVGPFANVAGSPNISRSGSQTELYGSYPTMTPAAAPLTIGNSRYAPNGFASTRSSSELVRGRPSIDSQRSPPGSSYGQESRQSIYSPMMHNQSPARSVSAYQPLGTSPAHLGTPPSMNSFQPIAQTAFTNASASHQSSGNLSQPQYDSYMPAPFTEEQPSLVSSLPESAAAPLSESQFQYPSTDMEPERLSTNANQATPAYDIPQSYGYEPPESTGYVPYVPDPESDDDSTKRKPKKKSFMDDDDETVNFSHRSESSAQPIKAGVPSDDDAASRRKAADDAANAAFLAAVAEDERKAKAEEAAKKASSGWFGGWLGGKKQAADSLDSKSSGKPADPSKPVQVHLGENKMKLYYDEKLKKWVNPDNPDSMKPKAGPPPPPRMGGAGTPPVGISAPPAGTGSMSGRSTPASIMGDRIAGAASPLPPNVPSNLGASNETPPPSAAGVPLPPSKAPTPLQGVKPSTTSATGNIDDLLGPPGGASRKAGPKGAKKKAGRYVDVMAK